MSAQPILFSGAMVRALLDGRKTQTRRIMNPQPSVPDGSLLRVGGDGEVWGNPPDARAERAPLQPLMLNGKPMRCRYGKPGDLLWVRETCFREPHPSELGITEKDIPRTWAMAREKANTFLYRADARSEIAIDGRRWTPSIHMPRAASRLTLELTDVRVQRLQDISGQDCWAEGIESAGWDCEKYGSVTHCYRDLWEQINGHGSWDANPWVWALTFKPHLMNIDEYPRRTACPT